MHIAGSNWRDAAENDQQEEPARRKKQVGCRRDKCRRLSGRPVHRIRRIMSRRAAKRSIPADAAVVNYVGTLLAKPDLPSVFVPCRSGLIISTTSLSLSLSFSLSVSSSNPSLLSLSLSPSFSASHCIFKNGLQCSQKGLKRARDSEEPGEVGGVGGKRAGVR